MSSQQESGNFFGSKPSFKRDSAFVPDSKSTTPNPSKVTKFIRSTPRPLREAAAALLTLATINGGASMVDTHAQTPPPQPLQESHQSIDNGSNMSIRNQEFTAQKEAIEATAGYVVEAIDVYKDKVSGEETTVALVTTTNPDNTTEKHITRLTKDQTGKSVFKDLGKVPMHTARCIAFKKDPVQGEIILVGGNGAPTSPDDRNSFAPGKLTIVTNKNGVQNMKVIDAKIGNPLEDLNMIHSIENIDDQPFAIISIPNEKNEWLLDYYLVDTSTLVSAQSTVDSFSKFTRDPNTPAVALNTLTRQAGTDNYVTFGASGGDYSASGYFRLTVNPVLRKVIKVQQFHTEQSPLYGINYAHSVDNDGTVHDYIGTLYPFGVDPNNPHGNGKYYINHHKVTNGVEISTTNIIRPPVSDIFNETHTAGGVFNPKFGNGYTLISDASMGGYRLFIGFIPDINNSTNHLSLINEGLPTDYAPGSRSEHIEIIHIDEKEYLIINVSHSRNQMDNGAYRIEIGSNGLVSPEAKWEKFHYQTTIKPIYKAFIPIAVKGAQ